MHESWILIHGTSAKNGQIAVKIFFLSYKYHMKELIASYI